MSENAVEALRRKSAVLGISVDQLAAEIVERGLRLVDLDLENEMPDRAASSASGRQLRPARVKLTAEESLRRMNDFDNRKDQFIASIRKGKG